MLLPVLVEKLALHGKLGENRKKGMKKEQRRLIL